MENQHRDSHASILNIPEVDEKRTRLVNNFVWLGSVLFASFTRLLSHFWLGDRKAIQPIRNQSRISRRSLLDKGKENNQRNQLTTANNGKRTRQRLKIGPLKRNLTNRFNATSTND